MRIIDGDALFEDLKECMKDSRLTSLQINGIALAATRIFEQPTIELEREKGEWIVFKAPDEQHCGLVKCPFCGEDMIAEADEYSFCPSCGADMRGLE